MAERAKAAVLLASAAAALLANEAYGRWSLRAAEAADEAARAAGGRPLQIQRWGVLPQVLPLWISYSLYRFESNVRSASVVGMVGAGGIGVVLWEIIRGFQYAQTCAVMIIIVVTVSLIDLVSARIRQALV